MPSLALVRAVAASSARAAVGSSAGPFASPFVGSALAHPLAHPPVPSLIRRMNALLQDRRWRWCWRGQNRRLRNKIRESDAANSGGVASWAN